MTRKPLTLPRRAPAFLLAAGTLILAGLFLLAPSAFAQSATQATTQAPLHPTFPLLDESGAHVLDSGEPVSTMTTCGACHDTAFISTHSFHSDVGLSSFTTPGDMASGRAWDSSDGLFGKWDPLTYRYLSPSGDAIVDLTTPAWLQLFGARHVGGGPAELSREGAPLESLTPNPADVESSTVDPDTGERLPWDWATSGTVEMNCFLCHDPDPNNAARVAALATGDFAWANTATLVGTGLVTADEAGDYRYDPAAFDVEGNLLPAFVRVQDPTNENCGQCHGLVHADNQTPLVLDACAADAWTTVTSGQIISPQRISDSGLNLQNKGDLDRSWDVHAERVVSCVDCHYALNNPIYFQDTGDSKPDHLAFDPRRIDFSDYLYRPLHEFAKGESAQGSLAPELDNTLRRCESCHDANATHTWLPYQERHMDVVSCETCHIPELYAPSRQFMDWTVLQSDGEPVTGCRGLATPVDGSGEALLTAYAPVVLPRVDGDGDTTLAPYNLLTSWYWIYGDPARPVPYAALEDAFLRDGDYHPDILAAFDRDGDGRLDQAELVIDDAAVEAVVAGRLAAEGLDNPRITGEVQPYGVHHDVTHGGWVTKDCRTCHGEDSLVAASMELANRLPGGVLPALTTGAADLGNVSFAGALEIADDGRLFYSPQPEAEGIYLFGHDSVYWIDWAGALLFLAVLGGVFAHGGLRYMAARRRTPHEPALRQEYMYSVYERLWHWLQTAVIFGLIFTGLVIHKPDKFGIFSFNYIVQVHNVLAAILVINAALSAFYHLVSGEIRQFLPRPYGFFDQAFAQAKFYLQGIFRGDEHPFVKSRERKMNPLQQITYFGILNVLLPLQVLTGILMWGAQRWPELAGRLGGLPFLAPFHTLIAWLFASFIVMHVYLTTTGHKPLAGIRAMIMGWDDVELPAGESRPAPQPTD